MSITYYSKRQSSHRTDVSQSPSGELIGCKRIVGVSQLVVCLQYASDVAVTVADFGADIPVVIGKVRHTSTFAFCMWNAGVTHAPQGHLSPADTHAQI